MTRPQPSAAGQRGAVLAVTLVLLLLLALTVTAMVRNHSVQTLLLANQQRSIAIERLTERSVEAVVSDADNFMQCQNSTVACAAAMQQLAADIDVALQCRVAYVGKRSGLGCSIGLQSTAPCHADYIWDVSVAALDLRRDSTGDFSRAAVAVRQGVSFFHRSGLPGCD